MIIFLIYLLNFFPKAKCIFRINFLNNFFALKKIFENAFFCLLITVWLRISMLHLSTTLVGRKREFLKSVRTSVVLCTQRITPPPRGRIKCLTRIENNPSLKGNKASYTHINIQTGLRLEPLYVIMYTNFKLQIRSRFQLPFIGPSI